MFCIFAFIVFLILGIFSAKYRGLAKKAWGCVWIRLTFKTCDISLQDEIRAKLIGSVIVTKPRLARFMDKWLDTVAFIFVTLSIWSLAVVMNSGLNYYIYGTCAPSDPESCSLSAGACGISAYHPGFVESVTSWNTINWTKNEATAFFGKFALIPDRIKNWDAKDYVSKTATYYAKYDDTKKVAIEIIDPGCIYCSKLFTLTKESGFSKKYNLSYVLFPIPNPKEAGEYKFKNSYLLARYAEALKKFPQKDVVVTSDWRLLENVYMLKDEKGDVFQKKFNEDYSAAEAEAKIIEWIRSFGYDLKTTGEIISYANGAEAAASIKAQHDLVVNDIRTVKIPTIMFGGRRYDRMVDEKTLMK